MFELVISFRSNACRYRSSASAKFLISTTFDRAKIRSSAEGAIMCMLYAKLTKYILQNTVTHCWSCLIICNIVDIPLNTSYCLS
jgi:hypothetical protein